MNDPTLVLRRARIEDVPFLARIDLAVDAEDVEDPNEPLYFKDWGEADFAAHRAKIASFVTDADKTAWVCEDTAAGNLVGMILSRCHGSMRLASAIGRYLTRLIDEGVVPADEPFCEVFQLWVDPTVRRRGLASALKHVIEDDARACGGRFIYTHTRETNPHVVTLNLKLGYRVIRTGPLWDDITRVSLIKSL